VRSQPTCPLRAVTRGKSQRTAGRQGVGSNERRLSGAVLRTVGAHPIGTRQPCVATRNHLGADVVRNDPIGVAVATRHEDVAKRTQWEFNAIRPMSGPSGSVYYTHGSCTIRRRTSDVARRCTSRA
jgi:hypothetical protein